MKIISNVLITSQILIRHFVMEFNLLFYAQSLAIHKYIAKYGVREWEWSRVIIMSSTT